MDEFRYRFGNLRLAALIVVVAVAAFLIWLLFIRGDDDGDGGAQRPAVVDRVAATPDELRGLAADAGQPLMYWAGPMPDVTTYEFARREGRSDGVQVRYLTRDAKIGNPNPFLTVATYPFKNALARLQEQAQQPENVSREIPGGGLAVTGRERANQVFVAFPDRAYQVVVFDRSGKRALDIATSGDIQLVP